MPQDLASWVVIHAQSVFYQTLRKHSIKMNSRWWLPHVKFNTAYSSILKVYFLKKYLPLTLSYTWKLNIFFLENKGRKEYITRVYIHGGGDQKVLGTQA